jgi:GNAT superfamily N-acetyltransferase
VGALDIAEVDVDDLLDLRRRVLRAGTPSGDPRLVEDDAPGAFHLAGRNGAAIVACVSFSPQPTAHRPGANAWRLRAMAVDPSLQGTGAGRQILQAGIERARASGATAVWAHARDSAVGFYERMGMVVVGDGFVDAATALPHHAVVLDL